MNPTDVVAPTVQAQCPKHPDRAALGTCARCGVFVCASDFKRVDDTTYCEACAALPEIDYLETFRLKYWGKRDGWAWLFLLGVPINLLQLIGSLAQRQPLHALTATYGAAVDISFFLGLAWARPGILALPVSLAVSMYASAAPESDAFRAGESFGRAIGSAIVPMIIAVSIFNDTRNQLFFKVFVPQEKLRKAWDLLCNNTIARQGFFLSIISVIAFPLAPIALLLSIVGLRRVDPNARPPIGRKGQAIAGVVISSLACVGGVAFLLALRAAR